MPKLSRVGIVGSGAMGAGITLDCARKGLDVVMADLNQEALASGMARIKSLLDRGLDREELSHEDVAAALMRIKTTTSLDDLAGCRMVIEAIHEDPEAKRALLAQLEAKVERDCVLATNTNSLGVEELARELDAPQRLVGLHFFPRPDRNRLLEIIPGAKTPDETLNACQKLAAMLDKDTITSGDRPGFAVSRFFIPWLNEALRLRQENMASREAIDRVARELFGTKTGPFAFLEAGGAGAVLEAAENLGAKLGPFYAPAEALKAMVRGAEAWEGGPKGEGAGRDEIENRLFGAVFLAAAQMLEEKVSTPMDAELGAVLGLGWEAGPFGLMNRLGLDRAQKAAGLAAALHEDIKPAECLEQAVEPWELPLAGYRLLPGGIGIVTLRRLKQGNALNPEFLEDLGRALDLAEADQECKTILLKGLGGNLCTGLDAGYLLERLKNGQSPEIIEFAEKGRLLLDRMTACPKWLACLLDGPALGAGAEMALACHTIVATPRGSIGFPETGMGIYPSLGGVQRSLKYLGAAMASYLVLTGRVLDAEEARQLSLVEYLVPAGSGMETIVQLSAQGNPLTKRGLAAGVQAGFWGEMAKAFGDGEKLERLLTPEGLAEAGDEGRKAAALLSGKAPLALKAAVRLINDGSRLSLEEGLDMETESLKEIFKSKDAREGLTSAMEHRSPVYVGA